MPPREGTGSRNKKRKRTIEATDPQQQPPTKRLRQKTPPEFWDNLSRVPLCRRALREFNRRTVGSVAPKPPVRYILKGDQIKQLKRFARRGGPNLRDIRGYPALETETPRTMSSNQSNSSHSRVGTGTDRSSAPSGSTRKTTLSSKDPAFEQALTDAKVYPYGHQYSDNDETPIPNDTEKRYKRLGQPRPSLSPSHFTVREFRNFERANMRARTEDAVRSDVFPIIRGSSTIPSGQNERFNHLEALASNISSAQPDYYDGSRPAELDRVVRSDLGPYIIPCNQSHRPLLPNHFTELKGPDGKASEMKRQITQDLGNGARGMLKAQSYGQSEPTYDGNAYTLGSTYHSGTGTLKMYAMHPTQPADLSGRPQYHTTQIRGFDMTDNIETFRQGATWYRNSRDLAKEYRDAAIAQANAAAAAQANATANVQYVEGPHTSAGAAYGAESQQTITSQDGLGEESDPSLRAPYESQSQEETVISDDEVYFTSQTAHDSETSMDDPDPEAHTRKRTPRPRNSRPRKRNTASSSVRESTATESWTLVDGRFHCFQGRKKVRSQNNHPRNVWVYSAHGWYNGGGKQWCNWKSDETTEYR